MKFSIFWINVKNSDVGKILISKFLYVTFQGNIISISEYLLVILSPNYKGVGCHVQEVLKK
jgi:hypothetical protein